MHFRKVIKVFKYLIICIAILFILVLTGVNLPFSQRIITKRANRFLHEKNLPAQVDRITLLVNGKIGLTGIRLVELTGDTVVFAHKLNISLKILPLLTRKVKVKSIAVTDATIHITSDPVTGKPDVMSLLSNDTVPVKENKKPEKSGKEWDISVKSVTLRNVLFSYIDNYNGIRINQAIGNLDIRFDKFSLINRQIYVTSIDLEKAHGKLVLNKSAHPKSNEKKSPGGWNFKLMKSSLSELLFILDQPDEKKQYRFSLANGELSRAGFDLAGSRISVARLRLDNPSVFLYSSRTDSRSETGNEDSSGTDFPGQWNISGDNIKIDGGTFHTKTYDVESLINDTDSAILISGFNTTLKDVRLSSRESGFNMNNLSFALNNGFQLDEGEILFHSDSTLKSFLETTLRTSSSKIHMKIEAGNDLPSLLRSYKDVPLSLNIDDARISARDLFDFLPQLKAKSTWKVQENFKVGINCNIYGTTDLLRISNFKLTTGTGVTFAASGELSNITNRSAAICSIDFGLGPVTRSRLNELLELTGSSVNMPEFEPLAIKGVISDSLMAPDIFITLKSTSGNIAVDGSVSLPDQSYNLKVAYSGLEIGKLSGIKDLDRVTGNIDIAGTDFIPDSMKIKVSVKIDSAGFRGYIYQGIRAEIDGDQGLFNFALNSSDTSFKCNLTGTYFSRDSASGGQVSGIFGLDAGRLNLFSDLSASGIIEGDIANSPSGLNASVALRNLIVGNSRAIEDLEHLNLTFQSSDTSVKGMIESDFLKAAFHSAGSLGDLQRIFNKGRLGIATIMDSSAQKRIPYISALPQTSISIESTYDPILGLVLNDTIFSYHKISAEMIKDTSGFARADILIDRFNFGEGSGFGTNIHLGTLPDKSVIMLSADSIKYGKIKLAAMQADISTAGDSAVYRFKAGDKYNRPLYDISGVGRKSEDKIKLRSTQAQWILNGFNWNVSPGDFLVLDPEHKDFRADLHWYNDQRSIDLSGMKSEKLRLELRKVGITTLMIPAMNANEYDGELTGKIEYKSNKNTEFDIQMDINQMKIAESKLGDLKITGSLFSDTTGLVESDVRVVMNDTSRFNLTLKYGKDKDQKNIRTDFSGIPLNTFESFADKYISGLHGEVSGEMTLTSKESRPLMNGEIRIRNTGLRIVPLNAQFYMPDEIIKLENSNLVFSQFTVIDSLSKKLSINGTIDLSDLSNIMTDLMVTSDLLQVMNTTEKDNPAFYGSVYINSNLRLSGPLQKPAVEGNIVLAEGTSINYRYTEDLNVSETQKIITFSSFAQENAAGKVKELPVERLSGSPDIKASIEINPLSMFNFQISRGFDIGVSIRGGGFLTYSLKPNKEMDLTGTYQINEGSSELKVPGWPRKDFIITPGSFLKWDGKIDDPELQVETTSKVRGSYLNPVDGKTREVIFLVYMKLSENLSQLEIMFDVRSEDQYITSVFNSLSADERMRQAINLLIFGSIQLPNLSSSSDYVTQQINQFWESQLNQITKSAIKKVDVSIGVDTYKGAAEGGGEQTYTSLSYQVKKDMFRDRGSVLVSGHMNDNSPASQQSNNVIENFIFEYALDSNRTKYLKIYRQQNYEDLLEGEVTKSGVGFIYRKNYDRLSDIWLRKKKPKK